MTAAIDTKTVQDAIVAALAEVMGTDMTGVTPETKLFEDLNLDSTSVLGLLMALEDNLDMQVEPENLEQRHLETVGALTEFVTGSQ